MKAGRHCQAEISARFPRSRKAKRIRDDFYAPHYIADMLSLMDERSADFVKLFGFFLYARQHEVFAYWDLEKSIDVHDRFVPRPKRKPRGSGAR